MSFHIDAKKDEIAKKVLIPGDPLRAKYIAKTYLKEPKLVNETRGILAYTGLYNGVLVTIIASGMGLSSMAIYAEELFKDYEVEEIIRIGTCGSHKKDIKINDMIVVNNSVTNSNFAYNYNKEYLYNIKANDKINKCLIEELENKKYLYHLANVFSTETFYATYDGKDKYVKEYDIVASEMESFTLFYLAKCYNKKAGCILTVSDCSYDSGEKFLTSEEKEQSMNKMIEVALNAIIK